MNEGDVMTHYRQVILNLAVEDDGQGQEEYLEELKERLVGFMKEQVSDDVIKEVSARVN